MTSDDEVRTGVTYWACPFYGELIVSRSGRPDECPHCEAPGDELTQYTDDDIYWV